MRVLLSIFFCHCETKWLGKFVCYWYLNTYDFLLKQWLAMTSIFFVILGICRNYIKCNYPKKLKHFVNFFVHFWNLHQIFNILKKNNNVFFEITDSKKWFDESLDSPVSEHPLRVNMSKRFKQLWNLDGSTFIILFDACEQKEPGRSLC